MKNILFTLLVGGVMTLTLPVYADKTINDNDRLNALRTKVSEVMKTDDGCKMMCDEMMKNPKSKKMMCESVMNDSECMKMMHHHMDMKKTK